MSNTPLEHLKFNHSFAEIRKSILPAPVREIPHANSNSVHYQILAAMPNLHNDLLTSSAGSLSAEKLHGLSSTVDGRDIAQSTAEQYFNDNVIYQLSEDQRVNLLGIKDKPVMVKERVDIMTAHPDDLKWYQDFISAWLPSVLSKEKNIKDSGKFKVNEQIIEADLTYQCTRSPYLRQTKLLYHYCYVEKVQGFSEYLKDAAKWTKEYVDYLTSDEFVESWILINKYSPDEIVKIQNREILSKLDILDPTTKSSQEVIGKLNMAVILSKVMENADSIRKHDLFHTAIKKILEDILSTAGESEIRSIAQHMKDNIQTGTEFLPSLLNAFLAIDKGIFKTPELVGETLWQKFKSVFTSEFMSNFFSKENNIVVAKRFLSTLFFGGASIAFLFGCLTVENMDTFGKVQFGLNTAALFSSVFVSFGKKFLTKLATRFGTWMFAALTPRLSAGVLANMRSMIKLIFTSDVATFLEKRCLPFLILIFASTLVQDIMHDVSEGNVGAIVMDSLALVTTIGEAIAMFSSSSWAGPAGVILAVLSIVFIVIKFKFFPDKTPAEKYYDNVVPQKYKLSDLTLAEPEKLSVRTDISLPYSDNDHKYISPWLDGQFHTDKYAYERSPFKLTKIGKSMITLSNTFPIVGTFSKPRYLERNTSNNTVTHNEGPTASQCFYLVAVPNQTNLFKLLTTDNSNLYLTVSGNNMTFAPNKDSAAVVQFSELEDWVSPNTTWSLPESTKLAKNKAIINRETGLGLIDSGLYLFPSSGYNEKDSQAFIEKNKLVSRPVMTFEKVTPAGSVAYVQVNDKGVLTAYDGDGIAITTATTHNFVPTKVDHSLAVGPYSLVFSRFTNETWMAIVDSRYIEVTIRQQESA